MNKTLFVYSVYQSSTSVVLATSFVQERALEDIYTFADETYDKTSK